MQSLKCILAWTFVCIRSHILSESDLLQVILAIYRLVFKWFAIYCDESVSRGRMTGTKGRRTGTIGTKGRTEGTRERGNKKPYGLVQIEYLDRGTSTRHVWTWRGRVTLFLDV